MKLAPIPMDDAGFTLIELLIALTLLGFLAILLFGGLKLGTRVWERSQGMTTDENRIRSVQFDLTDEIHQIYPMYLVDGPSAGHIDFEGTPGGMRFLYVRPGTGALRRTALLTKHNGDDIVLAQVENDELSVLPDTERMVLGKISALTFMYFGVRSGEKEARWYPEWRNQPRLPSLIRISAAMRDKALLWPSLVVAPRLDADEGCTISALTHACEGRQ